MWLFLLAFGWLAVDQWTKWLVMTKMVEGESIPVINNIFYLTYVRNPGAAFGMLPYKTAFFVAATIIVLAVIIFFIRRLPKGKIWLKTALALQIGGAVGNLIDRVRFGHVIDFFDFRIWPVFNVADIGIVIGVGILFIELVMKDKKSGEPGQRKHDKAQEN